MNLIKFIKANPDEAKFCNKSNRQYFGETLFNRLLVACESYKNEFSYIYG
jgi:hypothetical protein